VDNLFALSLIILAALEGARFLYLDYERLDYGPLKETVLEYINNQASNPCRGDAYTVLYQIDHFRDGKASQRIGEYVGSYLESLATTAVDLDFRRFPSG
jgi:hypothetical protein